MPRAHVERVRFPSSPTILLTGYSVVCFNALALGARDRRLKSCYPDQFESCYDDHNAKDGRSGMRDVSKRVLEKEETFRLLRAKGPEQFLLQQRMCSQERGQHS